MKKNEPKYYITILLFVGSIFGLISSTPKEEMNNTENEYFLNNQDDFDKYKNFVFPASAHIYFASGKIFSGQFSPGGSGTKDKPIKVTAYNPKSNEIIWKNTDNKPIINGQGLVNSAFYLHNEQFWEINNLEITNTDGTTRDQGDLRGIHVVAEDFGLVEHIVIRNCFVHHINGAVEGKERGGILVDVIGDNVKTKFNDLLIENNLVSDVGGIGIGNSSSWPGIESENYYPWTGVVIRGNRIQKTGRNGIIIRYSLNPLVEYNVLAYNGLFSKGHSIFNYNTIGCVMQFNEIYGNTGDINEGDRGAFDADSYSRETTIQYNYSHDNHWFCGMMRRYNKDVTVRYNISQNERLGVYFYGVPEEDKIRNVKIYNNTHFFRAGLNACIFVSPGSGKTRTPIYTSFYNNIFYFEDSGTWGVEPEESCEFSNNLFYNIKSRGKNYISTDPMFVNPGTGGKDINMLDPERLSGYMLKKDSPCLGTGIYISNNGNKDFWGNNLDNSLNIGAY